MLFLIRNELESEIHNWPEQEPNHRHGDGVEELRGRVWLGFPVFPSIVRSSPRPWPCVPSRSRSGDTRAARGRG